MPTEYYHVDRKGTIEKGKIGLKDFMDIDGRKNYLSNNAIENKIDKKDTYSLIEKTYGDKLSRWGNQYCFALKDENNREDATTLWTEYFFELVRLSKFPEKPSRFKSTFSFEKKEDAKKFRKNKGKKADDIWKVKPLGRTITADSNLLGVVSFDLGFYLAHKYWEEDTISDNPTWETVMELPIKAVKKTKI